MGFQRRIESIENGSFSGKHCPGSKRCSNRHEPEAKPAKIFIRFFLKIECYGCVPECDCKKGGQYNRVNNAMEGEALVIVQVCKRSLAQYTRPVYRLH